MKRKIIKTQAFKPRMFRALVNEKGLDDLGASGLTFEVEALIEGNMYEQADQSNYDEHGRNAKPFFVDDNGCSREIEHMLKTGKIEEIVD